METAFPLTLPIVAAGPGAAIDASQMKRPITLKLQVTSLTAAAGPTPQARVAIEDNFGAGWIATALFNIDGPITTDEEEFNASRPDGQLPSIATGAAGCQLRVNVLMLQGTTPQLMMTALVDHS
jgi:hypothetical protein